MGSDKRRESRARTADVVRSEQHRADKAEASARSWEAKWLQEKMNAKKDADHAAKRLGEAMTEIAALRQRVEELERDLAAAQDHINGEHGAE